MSHNINLRRIKQLMDYGYIVTIPAVSSTLQGIIPEESLKLGIRIIYKPPENIVADFAERMLSAAENRRACDALILASQGIHKRMKDNNEIPRTDGFLIKIFRVDPCNQEILENVLLSVSKRTKRKENPLYLKCLCKYCF